MRILVGTDGSQAADLAMQLVSNVRLPVGSEVRLVAVVDPMPILAGIPDATALSLGPSATRLADGVRESLATDVAKVDRPGVHVDTRVGFGRPADRLASMARDWHADLLVVGSRGRGPIRTMLLGSVSGELADTSPCPVLVVRGPTVQRVLFATDGSEAARATEAVMAWPMFEASHIEVVSVGEPVYAPSHAVDPGPEYANALASATVRAETLADATAARLGGMGRTARGWSAVGDPAAAIVERAAFTGTDLIVVGTRGLSGLDRVLLGSVARDVLTHAHCSVLVVGTGAEGRVASAST